LQIDTRAQQDLIEVYEEDQKKIEIDERLKEKAVVL